MLDYHIHTKLCGHANGEMEEYVQKALAASLQEMGFADHLPMLKWAHPDYAMPFEKLHNYVQQVHHLQREYPNLQIKLGIEADYYSGEEQATRELLEQYPFDYVYGSIHFIDGWAFDDPVRIKEWETRDVNEVYEQYYRLVQHAAKSKLFDIIGHFDLVKKFGHRPTKDLSGLVEETVRCCKEHGLAVEISTAGLRKPVKEIYPSKQIMRLLHRYNIPIVLGSDAHSPEEVAGRFHEARHALKALGFTKVVAFKQRKIVSTYPL